MNTQFKADIKNKGFLIAAHRGTYGANIIDNTFLSMDLAIRLGADMVEVDVMKSKDGELFAFHTGKEIERFGKDFDILQLDSKQIKELRYLNAENQPSGRGVESIEDILSKCKDKAYVNIDRADNYFEEVFYLVKKLGMEKQILMKSQATDGIANFLEKNPLKLMYMPIIRNDSDLNKFLDKNINTVAVEILFDNINSKLLTDDFKSLLKKYDINLWANAMNLGDIDELNYNARFDDDMSLESDGKGWQWLLDKGCEIIQTDWPYFLNQYRLQYYK